MYLLYLAALLCLSLQPSLRLDGVLAAESVSDVELKSLGESLLKSDVNNVAHLVKVARQGHADTKTMTDFAPGPLLVVDERVFSVPTIAKLSLLYDNYEPDTLQNEIVTPNEKSEESQFLNEVLKTEVMTKAKLWLQSKGYLSKNDADFRKLIEETWFTVYSRGHHKKSSSGFEHVFLGELNNSQVSGFHNWLYFYHEEKRNKLNYLGWLRTIEFEGKKGSILKINYSWANTTKPVGTLFVGTSPELELALYTVCFLVKPNQKCNFSLGGKNVFIQTYTFTGPQRKTLIGSAYPGI